MALKTVVATYCPEIEEMHCRTWQISPPYLEFMKSLSEQGVLMEVFDLDDYEVLVRGNLSETTAYMGERLTPEALVIHNRRFFIDSARVVFNLDGHGVKRIEERVDEMFYDIYPQQCHGLYTPMHHASQDVKRKDKLHSILDTLGVKTPRVYYDPDEIEYPCVAKKATGSRSKEVYKIMNPVEAIPFAADGNYILQEYVPSIVGYPLQIRAVTFGNQLLGAFLSFNPDAHISVYENMSTYNVPLGDLFLGNGLLGKAREIFDQYEIDGYHVIEEFQEDVENVGQYCADHGTLLVGIDILIDHDPKEGNRFLICDINKDPAPTSYLPLIDHDSVNHFLHEGNVVPVRAMAEINSRAAFSYFGQRMH
jgi:hypothetical protein